MRTSKLCRPSAAKDAETVTPILQRLSYGVGHVINDIMRQLLFSFRLVFFMRVLGLSAANAGWLIFEKKLVHAVTSPIIALLVDRINIPFLSQRLGRRKSWHLVGAVMGIIFTPLLFSSCFPCQSDGGQWQMMIYLGILHTILAVAATLMDIGHLSLIPAIAKNQSEAVELSAWRTAFTFLSGIATYLIAWAILGQDTSNHISSETSMDFTMMTLILIGIGALFALIFHVGTKEPSCKKTRELATRVADSAETGFDTIRSECLSKPVDDNSPDEACEATNGLNDLTMNKPHEALSEAPQKDTQDCSSEHPKSLGVDNKGLDSDEADLRPCHPECNTGRKVEEVLSSKSTPDLLEMNCGLSPETMANSKPESAIPVTPAPKTARAWLKDPHLYKVAIIFTCTKVLQNLSYTYLPLFLIYSLQSKKEAIAYLPLIMLTSATVSSVTSKKLVGAIGSKWCFILASLLVIGAGVLFYFTTQSNSVMTYPAVALLGFGFSSMLVNALSFAAGLIGENKGTSGVVFGFMSLMSFIVGGTLIGVIQKLFPDGRNEPGDCEECGDYVRRMFSFVPASLAAISLLVVLLFQSSQTTHNRNVPKTDANMEAEGAIANRR